MKFFICILLSSTALSFAAAQKNKPADTKIASEGTIREYTISAVNAYGDGMHEDIPLVTIVSSGGQHSMIDHTSAAHAAAGSNPNVRRTVAPIFGLTSLGQPFLSSLFNVRHIRSRSVPTSKKAPQAKTAAPHSQPHFRDYLAQKQLYAAYAKNAPAS